MFGAKCKKGSECPFLHEKSLPLTRDDVKVMKLQRKTEKNHGDIVLKANQLYNELRQSEITDEQRKPLMEKLMILTKDKIVELAFKHDSSRVIQCMLKYSNEDQRKVIYAELKSHLVECSKTKHGVFLVSYQNENRR